MAVTLVNGYKEYTGKQGNSEDVYTLINGKYIALINLTYIDDNSNEKTISSITDLKAHLGQELTIAGTTNHVTYDDMPKVFERTIQIPLSTIQGIDAISKTESKAYMTEHSINFDSGYNAILKLAESESDNELHDAFVYTLLDGKSNYMMIETKHLGYYEGNTFISLNSATSKYKTIAELANVDLYTDATYSNASVVSVYSSSAFVENKLLGIEHFDKSTATSYKIVTDKHGQTTAEVEQVAQDFAQMQPITEGENTKLKVKTFSYDVNGNNIKVRLLGELEPIMVNANDLYVKVDGDYILADFANRDSIIDKTLYLKQDNQYLELEKLSGFEYDCRYSQNEMLGISKNPNDRMGPTTKIKLDNAEHTLVQESDVVKPIAYKQVADTDDFDSYLFTVGDKNYIVRKGDMTKSTMTFTDTVDKDGNLIIPKKEVKGQKEEDKASTKEISISVKLEDAVKLKRTSLETADYVQTSSRKDAKIESCEQLSSTKATEFNDTFVDKYKSNEYIVNDCFYNGELTKLTNERYTIQSEFTIDDLSGKSVLSKIFEDKDVDFTKGKLKGVAHEDWKKETKKFFKKVWNPVALKSLATLYSGFGVLIMLAAPVVVVADVAVLAASAVGMPAFYFTRAKLNGIANKFAKDKQVADRKEYKQTLDVELHNVYEIANTQKMDKVDFLIDCKRREMEAKIRLGASQRIGKFKVEDGKSKTNTENVDELNEYIKEIDAREKELKAIKALIKLQPEKELEYVQKKAELDRMKQTYSASAKGHKQDKEYQKIMTKMQQVKAVTYASLFDKDALKYYDEKGEEHTIGFIYDIGLGKYIADYTESDKGYVPQKVVDELVANLTKKYAGLEVDENGNIINTTPIEVTSDKGDTTEAKVNETKTTDNDAEVTPAEETVAPEETVDETVATEEAVDEGVAPEAEPVADVNEDAVEPQAVTEETAPSDDNSNHLENVTDGIHWSVKEGKPGTLRVNKKGNVVLPTGKEMTLEEYDAKFGEPQQDDSQNDL